MKENHVTLKLTFGSKEKPPRTHNTVPGRGQVKFTITLTKHCFKLYEQCRKQILNTAILFTKNIVIRTNSRLPQVGFKDVRLR